MSINQYTDIYRLIYDSMKVDGVPVEIAKSSARRVTDAVWDLHLCLNFGSNNLEETINVVKELVQNQLS